MIVILFDKKCIKRLVQVFLYQVIICWLCNKEMNMIYFEKIYIQFFVIYNDSVIYNYYYYNYIRKLLMFSKCDNYFN